MPGCMQEASTHVNLALPILSASLEKFACVNWGSIKHNKFRFDDCFTEMIKTNNYDIRVDAFIKNERTKPIVRTVKTNHVQAPA